VKSVVTLRKLESGFVMIDLAFRIEAKFPPVLVGARFRDWDWDCERFRVPWRWFVASVLVQRTLGYIRRAVRS
jgi:hypothetical protein